MLKNFSIDEIINPFFGDFPYKDWECTPELYKTRLLTSMGIVQKIRDYIDKPIRLTSTMRKKDSKDSPHKLGFAVDCQIINKERIIDLHKNIMNWLHTQKDNLKNIRVFLEYEGNGMWFHIDNNYNKYRDIKKIKYHRLNKIDKDGNYPLELWIGYYSFDKNNNKIMLYVPYEGKTPMEMVK